MGCLYEWHDFYRAGVAPTASQFFYAEFKCSMSHVPEVLLDTMGAEGLMQCVRSSLPWELNNPSCKVSLT